MNDLQMKFIGNWKLVYSIEIDNQGNRHYPLGEDATGYIMYDKTGHMAVQISRKARSIFSAKTFLQADKNELAFLPRDYLAYFGHYEIDVGQTIVRHHLQGHLFPNLVGKILERKFAFIDDKLSLKPWDGTNREILWQKCSF